VCYIIQLHNYYDRWAVYDAIIDTWKHLSTMSRAVSWCLYRLVSTMSYNALSAGL